MVTMAIPKLTAGGLISRQNLSGLGKGKGEIVIGIGGTRIEVGR